MMLDERWGFTKIKDLTDNHIISLLGREMCVEYAVPAERGGDFYVLEAYGFDCDELKDIVSCTLDKNFEVYARLN